MHLSETLLFYRTHSSHQFQYAYYAYYCRRKQNLPSNYNGGGSSKKLWWSIRLIVFHNGTSNFGMCPYN